MKVQFGQYPLELGSISITQHAAKKADFYRWVFCDERHALTVLCKSIPFPFCLELYSTISFDTEAASPEPRSGAGDAASVEPLPALLFGFRLGV
jgi:hypothetical protein